ncbi:MAG TPA: alpha-L-rhamnosidase N-terminal domain-containing protein, partial [Puia sp.]|nr:alpha-L-rhamnosidase N-terminal domain-containing protein [Puia sp.]
MENPLGIDAAHPRFSWRLEDGRDGAGQSAYAVVVGADSSELLKGKGIYSTGKQLSGAQLISYTGPALRPFTRYYWKVDVWDKEGKKSGTAKVASFETGMMEMRNWRGAWISDSRNIHTKAAPYFRKVFGTSRKIRSARAYIAAAGLYELYINGHKIGDHRLDPMYTRFDRRNLYVTYDVTNELMSGDNAVGVLLG